MGLGEIGDGIDLSAEDVWSYTTRILTNLSNTRAALIDHLDADISSRLSTAAFAAGIADILTTDDFNTAILTLLTKAYFDSLVGARTDDPDSTTLFAALNALGFENLDEATELTPGDTETTMLEALQSEYAKYSIMHVEGYIDLSNMQSGDTFVLKEYAKDESGGSYKLFATHTYNNAQTEVLVHFTKKVNHVAWKITGQQSAGTNREFRSLLFSRRVY